MLCNLSELQTNLQSLLSELSEIHSKLIDPIQAKKSNTHSFLIKMPKLILLVRVMPYLSYEDVAQLATTCVGIRKTIYSPIGWRLLSRVITPYPLIIKENFVSQGVQTGRFQSHQMDNFPVHEVEGEIMLKKLRAECKKYLMERYQKFKTKEEQHRQLRSQLKREETTLLRTKMEKEYLKQQREELEETKAQYKIQLKETNQGFAQKIRQLDNGNDELEKETRKLQNQKEALVSKIREYQNQIESIKRDSDKSKLILKKIKNYLVNGEL